MLTRYLNKIRSLFIATAIFIVSILPLKTKAAGIVPDCPTSGCTFCDLLKVLINAGQLILGISGSLALLFFIVGGFFWLTSGGNKTQIEKGKSYLVNATIGLAIVFLAYSVISAIVFIVTKGYTWSSLAGC